MVPAAALKACWGSARVGSTPTPSARGPTPVGEMPLARRAHRAHSPTGPRAGGWWKLAGPFGVPTCPGAALSLAVPRTPWRVQPTDGAGHGFETRWGQ